MLFHLFRKVIAHFENAFVYMIQKTDKEKKRKGKKRKGEGKREKGKRKREVFTVLPVHSPAYHLVTISISSMFLRPHSLHLRKILSRTDTMK